MNPEKAPKIRVLIRKRPMNRKELSKNQTDIISIDNKQTVIVRQQKLKVDLTPFVDEYKFTFDGAFDESASNEQIYHSSVRPLVDCAFDGAKVTCFAYGQTGSGKTHTMLGNGANIKGLYLLAAVDIFDQLVNFPEMEVWISFYEIYCGKLYDLLNDKNLLFAREDAKNNVNIVGLSETKLSGPENLIQIIDYGMAARVTSQNGTNNDSSRSHAILQISLKVKNRVQGKISFIDLAGSERAADHADQLEKQTRIDGAEINKSLLALKECIRALDQNKNHTPFRGSKLTMVLKDSFTGYCRTVMIGNISPNSASSENTLNTLKYADRVKELKRQSRDNQIQMEQIGQLEKELMLPRNITKKNINNRNLQNNGTKTSGNTPGPRIGLGSNEEFGEFRENINNNIEVPSSHYERLKVGMQAVKRVSENQGNRNLNFKEQSHYRAKRPLERSPIIAQQHQGELQTNDSRKTQSNRQLFGFDQQREPEAEEYTEESLNRLSSQHESYIQRILEGQESLLKAHEQHINSTIELTKQEMVIKSEADKIGSRIEDYLHGLDSALESKLQSIYDMKGRIEAMRNDLQQSKRVQEQYFRCSRALNLQDHQQASQFADGSGFLLQQQQQEPYQQEDLLMGPELGNQGRSLFE